MRFSEVFVPTLKESPKDTQLKSHSYLVRAGYIQQVGSGIYNFLPLGKKVLDKIRLIIKEEMDKAGAQEVLLGFVTPAELWQESGRYEKYGKELLRFKDRKDNDFVLGPTHEEMVTFLARSFIKSYKQLPLNLYQIHTKFRDEVRPRSGLLRAREFVMKDSYSFHADIKDLDREFENMERAYRRILERLDLAYKVVEADSGAIGGSGSKEFMLLCPNGEDTLAVCNSCEYAANIEVAKRKPKNAPRENSYSYSSDSLEQGFLHDAPKARFAEFFTPGVKSIESLCEFFKVHPFYTMKCVAKKAVFERSQTQGVLKEEIVFFFLRGDDICEETKALNVLNGLDTHKHYLGFTELDSQELAQMGLSEGFLGALGLQELLKPLQEKVLGTLIFDESLRGGKDLICGANKKDYHLVAVDLDEFSELNNVVYADIVSVQEGDLCPNCGCALSMNKGIEVGHIFKLGSKYSQSLNATFLNTQGKSQPLIMGCYGIGVSRLLPAILEQKSDEFGCVWGNGVRVFDVLIIISNTKKHAQVEFANILYQNLKLEGVDVLLDDRDEHFGFKIKDFELIGFHQAVVVGKELDKGRVEWILREGLEKRIIESAQIQEIVLDSLKV